MADPTIQITPDLIKADGQNRVASTAGQAGTAGFVVVVGLWVAHQVGWNGDMPAEVVVAVTGLLTSAASLLKNRRRLGGQL